MSGNRRLAHVMDWAAQAERWCSSFVRMGLGSPAMPRAALSTKSWQLLAGYDQGYTVGHLIPASSSQQV